jgi:hypothetical protein
MGCAYPRIKVGTKGSEGTKKVEVAYRLSRVQQCRRSVGWTTLLKAAERYIAGSVERIISVGAAAPPMPSAIESTPDVRGQRQTLGGFALPIAVGESMMQAAVEVGG